MAIRGICLIKNEGDFIERSLRHNLKFFDRIYVYDNASSDDTWEVVQRLAHEIPKIIVPYASDDRDFRDGLRALPFNHFRHEASPGDWWCRLDADEVYLDDPRSFLAEVPRRHHVVWAQHLQYYFTELDMPGAKHSSTQSSHPFPGLPRHYLGNASEPRFFRHRDRLTWSSAHAWPTHLGIAHPRRILLRHYQWRSPEQIQRRLDTRREAADRGYPNFLHTTETSWEEKIRSSADLHCDLDDGKLQTDFHPLRSHLERLPRRFLKSCLHGLRIWP